VDEATRPNPTSSGRGNEAQPNRSGRGNEARAIFQRNDSGICGQIHYLAILLMHLDCSFGEDMRALRARIVGEAAESNVHT